MCWLRPNPGPPSQEMRTCMMPVRRVPLRRTIYLSPHLDAEWVSFQAGLFAEVTPHLTLFRPRGQDPGFRAEWLSTLSQND